VSHLFESTVHELNRLKNLSHWLYCGLSLFRAVLVASVMSFLWLIVNPYEPFFAIFVGFLCLIVLATFIGFNRKTAIESDQFLLSLDMIHPSSSRSPYEALKRDDPVFNAEWEPRLQREIKRLKAFETRKLSSLAASLVVPMLMSLLLWFKIGPSWSDVFSGMKTMSVFFAPRSSLEVVLGAQDQSLNRQKIDLSKVASSLDLVEHNILKMTIETSSVANEAPFIVMTPIDAQDGAIQNLQMESVYNQAGRLVGWQAEFSATVSADLTYILGVEHKVTRLMVHAPPVPKVKLEFVGQRQEPWSDQLPVPLLVEAVGTAFLKQIYLEIKSKSKVSSENVVSILDARKVVKQDYKLSLEPYMDDDECEFEIVAVAKDSTEPQGLVGRSFPIQIRVVSAYGRYKATLNRLSTIKSKLDVRLQQLQSGKNETLKEDREDTALTLELDEILQFADNSPFFDSLDRSHLERIQAQIKQATQEKSGRPKWGKMLDALDSLSAFLWEHETLDDRERDRDFFIAARTLSRVLESASVDHTSQLRQIDANLNRFLKQRYQRWQKRVEFLGKDPKLTRWRKVKEGPLFIQDLQRVVELSNQKKGEKAQELLAHSTNEYKAWIDELEQREDELRSKRQQEQQQGLADARQELRQLQTQQDQISSAIDRAEQRQKSELESKWQVARPVQNSNVKQTGALLEKLRALSPNAGERLATAQEAMQETVQKGQSGDFVQAESSSDLAGRLLRDAEQSAAKSQQDQQSRGRRKKTSGDNYFGNAIAGADIELKTEYKVDPRYRDEILRDASQSGQTNSDRELLNDYLRQILR
jgi:hypothetical protein